MFGQAWILTFPWRLLQPANKASVLFCDCDNRKLTISFLFEWPLLHRLVQLEWPSGSVRIWAVMNGHTAITASSTVKVNRRNWHRLCNDFSFHFSLLLPVFFFKIPSSTWCYIWPMCNAVHLLLLLFVHSFLCNTPAYLHIGKEDTFTLHISQWKCEKEGRRCFSKRHKYYYYSN